jgi:pimeloyl-ACP methyl ester carboxylesterase
LHYLEWPAAKPAVVFIPGLGDTAYMMSDFAARFSDGYRVISLTRRGFGHSSMPREAYDLSSRVEDIRALLDALHIVKAVLVGHSIAGDELTAFATKYPDRVSALIYLDAAYDRADPQTPQPTPDVWAGVLKAWVGSDNEQCQSSLDALRSTQRRTFFGVWTEAQEQNLREATVVNVDGTVSSRTPSWVGRAISDADRHEKLSIESIKIPALLIFARQRLERRGLQLDDATRSGLIRDEDAYERYFSQYVVKLKQQKNIEVEILPQTMHHLYLERPAEVERLMRQFLKRHAL